MQNKILIGLIVLISLTACATQPPTTQGLPPTAAAPAIQVTPPPAPTLAVAAAPAIQCTAPAAVLPSTTEGPYYKAGAPQRASLLAANTKGIKLVMTGFVLDTDCKPVAKAWLDFWQADAAGNYDNAGYTLRGYQYADDNGRYQLTTVIPGLYPGRTEHIHFKVQAPNGPVLVSQLFFPDVAQNKNDGIFNAKLLLNMAEASEGKTATFNFVVRTK